MQRHSWVTGDKQDKMLLIGHVSKNTDVVIHLRGDGTFIRAEKSDAEIYALH